MSDWFDAWVDRVEEPEAVDKDEEAFVERLALDEFAFMDELAAEKREGSRR